MKKHRKIPSFGHDITISIRLSINLLTTNLSLYIINPIIYKTLFNKGGHY